MDRKTGSWDEMLKAAASLYRRGQNPDTLAMIGDAILDSVRAALRPSPPLRLAVLFGSVARGQMRPDSDIDVAILPEDACLPLSAEIDLQARLMLATGRDVDVVRLDRAPTYLRFRIAREGVCLHAATAAEWVRFRAEAASDYADFAPAFTRAVEAFRRRVAGAAP